ncbi:MAG: acyl--CoA ligase, partial [Gammaproteobacteria bacterium]|nr:acyl--CoA ligase [Gammaproteobacteria bacterium]
MDDSKPSQYALSDISALPPNAVALLAHNAHVRPHSEALIDGEIRLDYRELFTSVKKFAEGLNRLGLGAGDRVAILMGNRQEWVVANFAAMAVGATVVALNTWATPRELTYQLTHSGARALVYESAHRQQDLSQRLREINDDGNWPVALTIMICTDSDSLRTHAFTDVATSGRHATDDRWSAFVEAIKPDDIACLLYTSGSTSTPKGVLLNHRGLVQNSWQIGERQHLTSKDRLWLAVSLFWSFGCVNALFAVMTHGGAVVLQHGFDAEEALALIQDEKCTIFYGTPNIVQALSDFPQRSDYDIRSLTKGVTLGTPAQIQRAIDLGIHDVCNIYGLTEAYGNSAVTDVDDPLDIRLNSCGRPLTGVTLEIRDPDDGHVCAAQEVGEILLKGYVTPRYLNDPEKTQEAFTADGFLRTGDIGYLDEDGYLYFRGRLKEIVKTGGINVAPAEIEEVLESHPSVAAAYVCGLPDARL